MSFLYPQFLYALFALSIPLIIHLFNFRRTKKVYFSNTRFLKKVKESSSSKRKLKHYLVLFARLSFIFFLVMAFAQPFIPSEEDQAAEGKTLIYLDNSFSMINEVDEDEVAFDEALKYITSLTSLYPSSAEYKILTNDFNVFSNVFKNKNDLIELTTEMKMTGVTRTFGDVKNRLTLNNNGGQQYDVYWISDFQKATSGGDDEIIFDSIYNVNLVPINFTTVNNVFVDSVYLDNPFLIGDEKLKLHVMLKNIGEAEVNDLIVKIYVDEVQSATASVNMTPNEVVTATFDLAFNIEGNNKCRISFEEFPVTFDNDFYFTLTGGQQIDVLEIKSSNAVTSIQNVYGNESLFDLKSVNFSNLDYNLVPEADLVVVNGLSSIDPSLAMVLNKYLEDYGNLVIIPAATADFSTYRQLSGLGNIAAVDSAARTDLASPDFKDPFFQNVFEETNQNFAMPEAAGVIEWGRDRTALLKYKSGMPFLSRLNRGGSVYLFASPFSSDYTNFQAHAIFVPVMYRIAAESASYDSRLYYYIDDPKVSFRADTLIADNVFKFRREGEEIIPMQRVSGNNVYMELPKFALGAGFYDLVFEGEVITTLAFNISPEESDLRQYEREQLLDVFKGNIDVFDVNTVEDFEASIERKYIGQPLWKYALILALIFLLFEVLFIRFLP